MNKTIHQEQVSLQASSLYNEDLAPVPPSKRNWNTWNMAAIWIGMAICIPTYMLAGGLIQSGMNWQQALFTILSGNCIVLIPMILNARAGTKYGIPFPVLIRATFGTRGAIVAGLLRAVVGCGWFGIQCWIGGAAIYQLSLLLFPVLAGSPSLGTFIGLNLAQAGSFLLFWLLNMWVIYRGIDTIKRLESWSAPFLLILGLGLLFWAWKEVGSFSTILEASTKMQGEGTANFWSLFWPSLTAMVGFWATLSLNIPDFSRYARSQKAQTLGQIMGLPPTMVLYSFIGIAVTSATLIIYGEAIWDPVELLSRFEHPAFIAVAMIGLTIATLSTNIAANVVAAANDFANIQPRLINFKKGGYITGVIGILLFPWKLMADPHGFIFVWLIGYSALLGGLGGIMLCDYYLIRKQQLNVQALYTEGGLFVRWSTPAWLALLIGLAPVLPGFLMEIGCCPEYFIFDFWKKIYSYGWFVTFGLGFLFYWILFKVQTIFQ